MMPNLGAMVSAPGRLARLDARIAELGRESLSPERREATPLLELLDLAAGDPPALRAAFADGLARIAEAKLEAFPENLFWDFDLLAASLLRDARRARDPAAHLAGSAALAAELQRAFGGPPIQFRYVHDFLYAFDWSKWVRGEPDTRAAIGPFDRPFLERMVRRGRELVALIEARDAKYGPIPVCEARNPFSFSREPADERTLWEAMAAHGELPARGWDPAADPEWARDFYALREARAARLGIAARSEG
ncbi:MAG: ferrochelatase [Myxococcota bacterium]